MTSIGDSIQEKIVNNRPTQDLQTLCFQFVLYFFRKQIKSARNLENLATNLQIQKSANNNQTLKFLLKFAQMCDTQFIPCSNSKYIFDIKVVPNQNGTFFKQMTQNNIQKIKIDVLFNDDNIYDNQYVERIRDMFQDLLPNQYNSNCIAHLDFYDYYISHPAFQRSHRLELFEVCQKLDTFLVDNCDQKDYVKQNENTILTFDGIVLNLVKQEFMSSYFPQYSKNRTTILVEMRMTGEMNQTLFKIMQNKQEHLLKQLVNIKKENYEFASKMLLLQQKYVMPQNLYEVNVKTINGGNQSYRGQ
eukprot:403369601